MCKEKFALQEAKKKEYINSKLRQGRWMSPMFLKIYIDSRYSVEFYLHKINILFSIFDCVILFFVILIARHLIQITWMEQKKNKSTRFFFLSGLRSAFGEYLTWKENRKNLPFALILGKQQSKILFVFISTYKK